MEPALKRERRGFSVEDESLRSAIAIAILHTEKYRVCVCVFVKMNSFDALLSQSALNRFFAWRHAEGPTFRYFLK